MKLITAKLEVTDDMMQAEMISTELYVKNEVFYRLKKAYEAHLGHAIGDNTWAIIRNYMVQLTTEFNPETNVWRCEANMCVPTEEPIFKVEEPNV